MKETAVFPVNRPAFAIVALCAAWLGIASFIAAINDGFHVFADQEGAHHILLTTRALEHAPAALAVSFVLIAGFWFLISWLFSLLLRRSFTESLWLIGPAFLPLAVLLLIPLRYAPGVTRFSAGAALLSGPLATALLFIAIVLSVAALISMFRREGGSFFPSNFMSRWTDGKIALLLFAGSLILLTATLPAFLDKEVFSGDQPHYLLVTHSLLQDGDIDISDDYADGEYRRFTSVPAMEPQSLRSSHDGAVVPFHKIGLSVLALPFYAVAGKFGAVWMIALLTAAGAALTYMLLIRFTLNRSAALLGTAFAWASVPLSGLSYQFMTEVPLTTLALLALVMLYPRDRDEVRLPWLTVLMIWLLPWLHTRGFAAAVGLTLVLLWRMRRGPVIIAILSVIAAALALLTPLWNYYLYNDFSLVAQMGASAGTDLSLFSIPSHFLGLLFDSRYGLLLFNPAALLIVPGVVSLWRRGMQPFLLVLVFGVFAVGPGLAYAHWWGGMYPARYIAMAMPAAGLCVAAFFADERWRRFHGAGRILLFFSTVLSVLFWSDTRLITSLRRDVPSLLSSVSLGPLDAVEWWPSWFAGTGLFLAQTGLLIVAICAAVAMAYFLRLHICKWSSPAAGPLAISAAFAAVIIVLLIYAPLAEQLTPDEPNGWRPVDRGSDLELIRRYRAEDWRIIDLLGGWTPDALPERGFSAIRLFSRAPLKADESAPGGRYYPIGAGERFVDLAPSTPIWAGRYRAGINLRTERPGQRVRIEMLDLSLRGSSPWRPAGTLDLTGSGAYETHSIGVELPLNSIGLRWRLQSDEPLRFAWSVLTPEKILRRSDWTLPKSLFNDVGLRYNEYDLFVAPGDIYPPDGGWFWTRADVRASWRVLAPKPFEHLYVSVYSQPPVRVTAQGSGEPASIAFDGGGMVRFDVAVFSREIAGGFLAPLRLDVEGAYIPAEVKPESEDHRRLGAHVRIAIPE